MSSFQKAIAVEHSGRKTIEGEEVYVGNADPLWTVSAYVLRFCIQAYFTTSDVVMLRLSEPTESHTVVSFPGIDA